MITTRPKPELASVAKLADAQVKKLEDRNQLAAEKIPDSAVIPLGSGLYKIIGTQDYEVDLWSPLRHPTCNCTAWNISNPRRMRELGRFVRCKHILKTESWVEARTP